MTLTLSIIKADTGGFVGHSSVHPDMLAVADAALAEKRGSLLIDFHVTSCGDDLALEPIVPDVVDLTSSAGRATP